jgi:hypothetical protein
MEEEEEREKQGGTPSSLCALESFSHRQDHGVLQISSVEFYN